MKNKIKPSQYDPYDFSAPSGNLIIESGINSFEFYLPLQITGDFNIEGSLKVNDLNAIYPNETNTVTSFENGNRIFAGSNNSVSGVDCVILGGNNSSINGGVGNLLYGEACVVNGYSNSISIGKNVSISHGGAAVFSDFTDSLKSSQAEHSITFDYQNGLFLINTGYFLSDININGNLNITGNAVIDNIYIDNNLNIANDTTVSGDAIVIGSLGVTGTSTFNHCLISGSRVQTQADINAYSGYATGTYLTSLQAVTLTGDQNVTGIKTFKSIPSFEKGIKLPTSDTSRYVPSASNSTGTAGQIAFSGDYLYIATGTDQWGRVQLSTW